MKLSAPFASASLVLFAAACAHAPSQPAPPAAASAPEEAPLAFHVSFPSSVRSEPATGRLLLFLSQKADEPRKHIDWFNFDPVFALEVTNVAPGATIQFTPEAFREPDALAFPKPLGRLPAGEYRVQALLDLDQTARDWNDGPGNLYSAPQLCRLRGSKGGAYQFELSHVVDSPSPMATNEWIELVEIKSALLSEFHGREVLLRAGVLLPHGYRESARRYPVVYSIPGFSGRHTAVHRFLNGSDGAAWKKGEYPYRALHVALDPDVPLGHSVFANSDNNGPAGDALVRELIPAIEERFRVIPEPAARIVTGYSSGGWSSLWLQTAYPDFFGGCWSIAPDPVDFRFFQTMNIYSDANGHWDSSGQPRALARDQHRVLQTFTQFNHWEYVTGPGGQLDSFNAVFSGRGPDGRPLQLMDKLSGAINPAVAESWKRYDIRLILQENWPSLGPKLHGKLRVIAGSWDTFYLDTGARGLAGFLSDQGLGQVVEFVPGDHGSLWTERVREKVRQEMAAHFRAALGAVADEP